MTRLEILSSIRWSSSTCSRASTTPSPPSSHETPYLTSSICVYEVLAGTLGRGETDVRAERQRFGGVRALAFDEEIALEAARLQDELLDDGERMAVRDLVIAATARSSGDHLVVADSDFQTGALESTLDVTNLRTD